jgi:hypothetical protein
MDGQLPSPIVARPVRGLNGHLPGPDGCNFGEVARGFACQIDRRRIAKSSSLSAGSRCIFYDFARKDCTGKIGILFASLMRRRVARQQVNKMPTTAPACFNSARGNFTV